ncbi:DUF5317 family protein [Candidatus Poriferisodalis sp.]|uniref:DUF5317 family protein n=1 Tax=Candidatus Poriferisodalis sp. TaxID=3101277 RepID=UPI003B02D7B3
MFFIALLASAGLGVGFSVSLLKGVAPRDVFVRLRMLRINHWPVLVLGAVLSFAVTLDTNMLAGRFALGVSLALLLGSCVLNQHVTGALIVAVGISANLAVLLLNGYLPVSEAAVVAAGIIDVDGLDRVLLGTARGWADDATIAAWLGSAVPLAPLQDVITLGDLVTAVGLANVGFRLIWPAAGAAHRLAAVSRGGHDDFDDKAVVLRPIAQPTTLEHPPLIGDALHAQPAIQSEIHPAAAAPTAPAPMPAHSEPAWASRVEPVPWPAPAPWPDEATDAAGDLPSEAAETLETHLFKA